jgi:hypothetical protein
MAIKKSTKSDDMLTDAARAIGTALGTMSAQADALAARAKKIHLPSREEAKGMVSRILSGKKKVAAKKPAAPAKKAPAKKKPAARKKK